MAFYIIAILIVVSAILVTVSSNPVASALWFVVCLFLQAVLFVTLDAHLVAALQVLLYAGAIMVLILFVIMLLNLSPSQIKFKTIMGERVIIGTGALYIAATLGMALSAIYKGGWLAATVAAPVGTVEGVGDVLLIKYFVPFELVSVTLLAAIIGTVVLAKK